MNTLAEAAVPIGMPPFTRSATPWACAEWQRDLALSHGRVAMALTRQGERPRALSAFRQGREIIAKLKATAPTNAISPKDLAWFDEQIAALEKKR
jgi:hypothetical protein